MWASRLDAPYGLDEGDRVSLMLFDTGRHCENIGVEDDVFGCKAFLEQDRIGARANINPTLQRVCLAVLVECHHHRRGTVPSNQSSLLSKLLLAVLQ